MSVEAVATRAAEKILPEGVEIFFRLLVLPLGLCFCEQSGGMTKTALPIRFNFPRRMLASFGIAQTSLALLSFAQHFCVGRIINYFPLKLKIFV